MFAADIYIQCEAVNLGTLAALCDNLNVDMNVRAHIREVPVWPQDVEG